MNAIDTITNAIVVRSEWKRVLIGRVSSDRSIIERQKVEKIK
jgi:hypothetical protein